MIWGFDCNFTKGQFRESLEFQNHKFDLIPLVISRLTMNQECF